MGESMSEDEAVVGLMAALLPGGAGFPAAQDTGMAALLLERLRRAKPAYSARVVAALTAGDRLPLSPDEWRDAASRMEALEPKLFAEFRKFCYLTYYEQPEVIVAIRALGFRYNVSPLPEGYPDEPFEPARDAPHHTRGHWLRTEEVKRVDLSAPDMAGLPSGSLG